MLPMLRRQFSSTLAVFLMLVALPAAARAEDGYDLWLRYAPIESAPLRDAYRQAIAGLVVQQTPATGAIVTKEVTRALKGLLGVDVPAWTDVTGDGALVIGTAVVAHRLGPRLGRRPEGPRPRGLRHPRARASAASAPSSSRRPATAARSTARSTSCACCRPATPIQRLDVREQAAPPGRASSTTGTTSTARSSAATRGRSLWKWDELPATIDPRLHDYARANASIGINGTVINSVNANAEIADAPTTSPRPRPWPTSSGPYGLRVYLSANFAAPGPIGGLPTADPLDPAVAAVVEGQGRPRSTRRSPTSAASW